VSNHGLSALESSRGKAVTEFGGQRGHYRKERHTANPYERGSLSGVKACDEKPKQCSTVQR